MFTTLALVLLGVLVVLTAIASVVFFLRARAREESGAESPDTLSEMRALGQRIETLVGQQQVQGETARQHLAQKLDAVGQSVDQQRHHVSGLQNELRHEVRRRDAEMDEIRTQLASIQQTTALGPAGPAPLALPPASEPAGSAPFDAVPADVPAFRAEPFPAEPFPAEPTAFESFPAAFEAPFSSVPTGDGRAAAFGETPTADGWDTGAPAPSAPAPAASIFSDPFALVDPFASASEPPAEVVPLAPAFSVVDPFEYDEQPASAPLQEAFAEPTTAAAADFEPFDFLPPTPPAESAPSDTGLFEDVSFGSAPGFAFEDLTAPVPAAAPPAAAPLADTAFAVPVERVAPAPPSQTAWVARTDRQDLDGRLTRPVSAPIFETPAFVAPAFEAPAFEMPSFDAPAFEAPAVMAPAFAIPDYAPPVPEPSTAKAVAPPPFAVPEGADDLTVISTIDEHTQHALYLAGVTTLDEIARWNRGDARRIAGEVSVHEDTIMHQWVFEAQAALFHSYSAQQRG